MKIEGKELDIYDLDEGDVFAIYNSFNNNYEIYMKTDSLDNYLRDLDVNAVNLSNGRLASFDDKQKIYPVSGKFVYEEH